MGENSGVHRSLIFLAVAVLAVGLLAGCVETQSAPDAAPSSTPSDSTTSAVPQPTPLPTSTAVDIPVTVACKGLVTDAALAQLFSDFVVDTSYAPAAGSTAASFVARKGVACGWKNSKGETLEVTVVGMPADELTMHKNDLVTSSNSVPTYAVEGYFRIVNRIGIADAFTDPYWIVTSSTHYLEPGDAAPVVASAIKALG